MPGIMSELVLRLVWATAVVLVVFILAFFLKRFLADFLSRMGLDDLSERTGASGLLWRLGYSGGLSRLLSLAASWAIVVIGIAGALSGLGLSYLQQMIESVANLSGQALVALGILIAGVMAAGWLSQTAADEADRLGLRGASTLRRAIFGFIVAIAALLAAGQLGLETSVLLLLMVVVFGTVGLTVALALGPGLVPLSGNIAAGRYVAEDLSVGDEILVEGVEGTVEELGHASITLRSPEGYLYRIPNRTILEGIVRKWSPPENTPQENGDDGADERDEES